MKYLIFTDFFIAFNLLLLSIFFFFKKNNNSSNKILSLIIFIAFFTSLNNGLMYLPGSYKYISLNIFLSFIVTFFGPLMLFYIDSIMGKDYKFEWKHLLHLIPAIPAFCTAVFLLFASDERKMEEFDMVKKSASLLTNIVYFIVLIQSTTYLVIAKRRVNSYKKSEEWHGIKKISIEWLNFFVNQIIAFNIIIFLTFLTQSLLWPDYNYVSELIVSPLCAFAFYLVISFKSFSYHSLFDQNRFNILLEEHKKSMGLLEPEEQAPKIFDENTQQQMTIIKGQLDVLLNEKKIYTDSNLTLQKLAEETKFNKNVLSLTINSLYGKSFYELINGYRIEEAKRMLLDKQNKAYKIESIGEMAGFNSRATFFAVFKKMCDMTPLQFQKMHQNQD